jgi:hypothetical protein
MQQRRLTMSTMKVPGRKRLLVSATFYCCQLTIGYMLMLVIMIYSGALFLATVLGLVLGHVLFNAKDAVYPMVAVDDPKGDNHKPVPVGDCQCEDGGACTCGIEGVDGIALEDQHAAGGKSSACCCMDDYDDDDDNDDAEKANTTFSSVASPNTVQTRQTTSSVTVGNNNVGADVPEGITPCCQFDNDAM